MPFSEAYRRQAALVVRALPEVAREDCFALKGGTGINLFATCRVCRSISI